MGKIQELPKSSSCLLTSSQIITSVYCVVKELVENALDVSSKNIEVKLEDYGLEKIEVKDNGCGIDEEDIQFVAKPHYTSKISSFSDLEKLNTYGFRGEALSAICSVADLFIITKTSGENIGHLVNFSHDGQIISNKPFPCSQGTTVTVKNLFKNIPVRRQYYRSEKNKKDDLRKVEDLLIAFGCIQNDVRFALQHNKNLIWQKPALSTTEYALIHILGNSIYSHLKHLEYVDEKSQLKIDVFLPKLEAPLICSLTSPNRCITAINNRPVRMKAIDKLLKEYYNKSIQNSGKSRYPICFISFVIPVSDVDVNIEPNKTAVSLLHSEEILSHFSELLETFYNTPTCQQTSNQDRTPNTSDFLNSFKVMCDAKIQETRLASTVDSPGSSVSSVKKDASIVNSVGKSNTSITKKDVSVVGTPTKPKKKKLKSILSKSDIDNHINTLKKFFPTEEKGTINRTEFSLNSLTPSVTIERISSNLNERGQCENSVDSEKITTFAVSKNLTSDSIFPVNGDYVNKRKRHFSESSIFEKVSENVSKRLTLDLKDQNGDAWSRGIHPSGGLFQPVKVLQPKAINIPEPSPKDDVSVKKNETTVQKKLSFERKLTEFDMFCRSNRLEVAAQNPQFTNQQIAEVLSEKWNRLSAEEKAVYRNILERDYLQQKKKKEKLGQKISQHLSQESDRSPSHKTSKKKMRPKFKEKSITFDINKMKIFNGTRDRIKPPSEDLVLIHYLAPGIWVCAKGRNLYLLNTFRLREMVIYHRLLETFHFESTPLDVPQSIDINHMGHEGLDVLYQLSHLEENCGRISDERLIANGFDVRFVRGDGNETAFQLVGITKNIAFYGVSDLKELLGHLKNKGVSAKLSECRPGKVVLYLQSEANRMSRQSPACQRVQDVEDLLRQKRHLPSNCEMCIHHKPFFSDLCKY